MIIWLVFVFFIIRMWWFFIFMICWDEDVFGLIFFKWDWSGIYKVKVVFILNLFLIWIVLFINLIKCLVIVRFNFVLL